MSKYEGITPGQWEGVSLELKGGRDQGEFKPRFIRSPDGTKSGRRVLSIHRSIMSGVMWEEWLNVSEPDWKLICDAPKLLRDVETLRISLGEAIEALENCNRRVGLLSGERSRLERCKAALAATEAK